MRPLSSLALALLLTSGATLASAASQQQSQVPGYHRMMLGDFEVTALYDGYTRIPTDLLQDISAEDVRQLLDRMFIDGDQGVQTAVNGYLIHLGQELVLVDTGAAACFGDTLGNITRNLRAAGYQPEDVDTVLLTHLHPDHACGLRTAEGGAAFVNADVYVSRVDADFWLNDENARQAPAGKEGMFQLAQQSVEPYRQSGRLHTYESGEDLLPGLAIVDTPGHTPGHASYLFSSQGHDLLVWGDIVHSHSVQFSRPEVSIDFDSDPAMAKETRQRVLAHAAEEKLWIAGAHLPFPGIGHVRREGEGYAWVPVEYAPLQR